MRKIDKLLLKSFLGPFFLTFVVVVFILLMQHMLKYMDDILGKDLGILVIAELLMYFAVFMTPVALPLAVLLSSLMTYGNLGEHFELTAIKSAGISLLRTLRPLFFFVCLVTVFAFLSNNYLVPKAALKAYSLLYDIKQKKPSLELKEGTFYDGIPGYSIKVEKKYPDGIGLKNLIIYNHAKRIGNSQIIMADSGRMKTILNSRYLSLELFNGHRYAEGQSSRSIQAKNKGEPGEFVRSSFDRSKYIFSLASFDMDQTPEELFAGNKMMKDIKKLRLDIDSMDNTIVMSRYNVYKTAEGMNDYHMKNIWKVPEEISLRYKYLDSIQRVKAVRLDSIKKAQATIRTHQRADDLKDYTLTESDLANLRAKKEPPENITRGQPDPRNRKLSNGAQPTGIRPNASGIRPTTRQNQRPNVSQSPRPGRLERSKAVTVAKKPYAEKPDTLTKQPDSSMVLKKTRELITDSITADSVRQAIALQPSKDLSDDDEDDERRASNSTEEGRRRVEEFWARNSTETRVVKLALSRTRQTKTRMANELRKIEDLDKEIAGHVIKLHQKYSHAIACMIMFIIGAPLGAIIKRGGLGVPVLISIFFFIIFYVLVISGQNWGEEGAMKPELAVWVADIVLLPFGIVFMIQAKNDARLLETDFYNVWIVKISNYFIRNKDKE